MDLNQKLLCECGKAEGGERRVGWCKLNPYLPQQVIKILDFFVTLFFKIVYTHTVMKANILRNV